ncbi:MAG: hypothetical protein LBO02_03660 [Holosporaceae bacterium]|jgi:PmbA protein|nr:hypothetical protein [Holosporaceae bacterium]
MDSEILEDAVRRARKSGADNVDILIGETRAISATTRLAKLENVVQADKMEVKMRLSIGKRSAVIATNNLEDLKGELFVEKAVCVAKNSPEEDAEFRPSPGELCKNFLKMDICDNRSVTSEELIANALECEEAALQIDGITNSGGAEASYFRSKITLVKNDDFEASYEKTRHQISVVTLAEKNGFLEQAYDFSEKIYYSDLKSPEQIAQKAAERTLKKLGAKKISSRKVPVIFDRMVSGRLLGNLIDVLNGASVAKGISFLRDKLFQKIFGDDFCVVDRYAIQRGLRSRPFDSDGLECSDNIIIENGALNSFFLNTKYANQLKMKSTGNADGFEGIAPNNVYVENGKESFLALLKSIKNGLYITEVLGNGLNLVTGNYSQGAVGFLIENGEITYPVSEITVAGNFMDMLSNCVLASDLEMEYGINAPTILINDMIVGGI